MFNKLQDYSHRLRYFFHYSDAGKTTLIKKFIYDTFKDEFEVMVLCNNTRDIKCSG